MKDGAHYGWVLFALSQQTEDGVLAPGMVCSDDNEPLRLTTNPINARMFRTDQGAFEAGHRMRDSGRQLYVEELVWNAESNRPQYTEHLGRKVDATHPEKECDK